jgi:hypothetical protein
VGSAKIIVLEHRTIANKTGIDAANRSQTIAVGHADCFCGNAT